MSDFEFEKLDPEYSLVFLPCDGQYNNDSDDRVVRSLGFISEAVCGDGTTSTTFPTSLPTRGLSFDGGDYLTLDWSSSGYLDTQTFTLLIDAKPSKITADSTLYEIGIAGQRYSLYFDYSEEKTTFWKDDTTDQTLTTSKGYPDGQHHIYAISNSINGMKLYVDGILEGSISGDVGLSVFDSSSLCYIGQNVAGSNKYTGNIYQAAIFPFSLNITQIKEIGIRMKQIRNI